MHAWMSDELLLNIAALYMAGYISKHEKTKPYSSVCVIFEIQLTV